MRAKRFSGFTSHAFTSRPFTLHAFASHPFIALIARSLLPKTPKGVLIAGASGFLALALGGCAQQPVAQRTAHSKEYFPSSIYGRASPRVVADGEAVPRGGGVYLVGRPYSVAGQTYYPSEKRYAAVGTASWYGDAFHGRRTANGEVYDRDSITAAHPTMPLPSYARVTNLRNNLSMIVRVNDRGPFSVNRIMDVSRATAEALDFRQYGTAKVKVEYVGAASLAGSDDQKLMATLRSNGPAVLDREDGQGATMMAQAAPLRSAAAEPPPSAASQERTAAEDADEAPEPAKPSRRLLFAGVAPLPPARPLDLAKAPGARVQMAARTRQANLR